MVAELQKAEYLLDLDRPVEAEGMLRSVLAGGAEQPHALRLLTLALHDQSRHREALAAIDRAIALEADSEHGHRLRSIVLVALERTEDAVQSAHRAIELAPWMWQTHYTLGMALRSGRRPRSRDALACANEAVRLAPHESHAHNLAGLCLDDLNLGDEAILAYSEALRLDPDNATAMNNLAVSRAHRGKLGDASRILRSGLAAAPQQTVLHRNHDAILLLLVRRLYFALLGLGALLAILAGARAPYAARVATVIVLLAVYAFATRRVTTHLPRGSHLWTRGLFSRSTWLHRTLLSAFVLLSCAVVVIGVAPRSVALDTGLAVLVVLRSAGLVMIVVAMGGAVVQLFRRG